MKNFAPVLLAVLVLAATPAMAASFNTTPNNTPLAAGTVMDNLPTDMKPVMTKAMAGDMASQYKIGEYFDQRNGISGDFGEAAKWYTRAASQGNQDAQSKLGEFYAQGLGVEENAPKSYFWFSLAAKGGKKYYVQQRDAAAKILHEGQQPPVDKMVDAWKPSGPIVEAPPPPPPPPPPAPAFGITPPDQ